jgi:Rieske Fe-S protein
LAELNASFLSAIEVNELAEVEVGDQVLYLFRPSPAILARLNELGNDVHQPEYVSYADQLGLFLYWAHSTYSGCKLTHLRVGDDPGNQRWPGGYVNNCRDSSYDYAGRTIKNPSIAAISGFVPEVDNLAVPVFDIDRAGILHLYAGTRKPGT